MSVSEVEALLEEADGMAYGPARTDRCDEAVRIADATNDEQVAYDARIALIESAVFGGSPQKAIVAFAWCVAKSDAEPERFPERGGWGTDLLWMHKWVAGQVHAYPQITRAQVHSALDDMEKRYTRHGLSLRPLYQLRMHASLEMDEDLELAHDLYRKWQWAKRDSYADCSACETHSAVEFHIKRGQHERAFDTARPLLEGRQACAEVPHHTYAMLLLSARALGRDEELEHLHRVGLPMVRENPDFVRHLALHVDHLTLNGRVDEAAPLVTKMLGWTRNTQDLDAHMWVFASTKLFLEKGGEVRMPPELGVSGDPIEHFDRAAKAIAERFDARNGNTLISTRLAAYP